MKNIIIILLTVFVHISCCKTTNRKPDNNLDTVNSSIYTVQRHFYYPQSIPLFVSNLIANHIKDFALLPPRSVAKSLSKETIPRES